MDAEIRTWAAQFASPEAQAAYENAEKADFQSKGHIVTWTVSTARDGIVGRAASYHEAMRGCLNDYGRTLIIHDPIGRIAAIMRDGRELEDELAGRELMYDRSEDPDYSERDEYDDTDYPHNPQNPTCPGPGIKCLCYDIDGSDEYDMAIKSDHS